VYKRHHIIVKINHDPIQQFNIKINEIVKKRHDLNLLDGIMYLIFQLMS